MNNQFAGKLVNIDYLRQLSRGNTRFVEEMIRIFLSENPEEIKVLEKAIDATDYGIIKAGTHKLRSTLPYIGLDRIVEHEVAQIELLAAGHSDIEDIRYHFTRIRQVCEAACQELQPYRA
jgi:HPt (histidine-containing phosphotransfer) domain-containing protein